MERYEGFVIRTYAARALRLGESPRVARPTPELAEWLVDHAHTVGCREPEVGNDAFDMGARRIDRDTWAKFTPLVAALKRRLKMPPPSGLERRMTWLCEALGLSRLETDLLGAAVRVALSKPVETLAGVCNGGCGGEVNKVGLRVLTGHDERAVKRALRTAEPLLLLGLLEDRGGGDVEPSPTVMRIARLETADPDRLRDALMGKSRKAELVWTDFAHLGEAADLAERFLAAALAKRTEGVNILLHGSPGTGKTEFARTLAERLGVSATFIGEIDEEEGEPTRAARVAAFAIGRALAGRAGNTLLVVDEADDIFTGVDEDDAGSRVGSKVFMNRLVEQTPAPTVWITNHKERLGAAVLRRMSLAIRFPEPGRAVRRRVVERIAGRHRLRLPVLALEELSQVRASPAVIDAAVRLGKLTGGGRADIERPAR